MASSSHATYELLRFLSLRSGSNICPKLLPSLIDHLSQTFGMLAKG